MDKAAYQDSTFEGQKRPDDENALPGWVFIKPLHRCGIKKIEKYFRLEPVFQI